MLKISRRLGNILKYFENSIDVLDIIYRRGAFTFRQLPLFTSAAIMRDSGSVRSANGKTRDM